MNSSPQGSFPGASVPKYNVWRAQSQILEDVAAYNAGGPGINISGGEHPQQVKGIHVSHEFFRLFGAPVGLGRTFTAEEDRPRSGRVVVLSHGLWQSRFGSDPSITGRAISLGGSFFLCTNTSTKVPAS
jgi:putative ABC transport system permease protein